MKVKFMLCLQPTLPVLLLAVMIVLPCCACGSPSFQTGALTKRARCDDVESLSPHSLKLPFIIGNKKACFSALNPPVPTTIIQTLPFIMSLVRQESSGVSDFLFSPEGQSLAFAQWQKKNSPAPEKVFQALIQDLVTGGDSVSLKKQFHKLIDHQQQLTNKGKENRSYLYIAMINEELRAVVAPGQVIPELLFSFIRHWLLDAELALYLQILPEADWLDLQPELEAIASVSPAIAAAGDDGDPDREPDRDPEPALFIAGEFGVQPWIAGLYSQAVLQKQRLLGILRQRTRQAIASGNHDLAQILRNRIMVIEADLSDLVNSESQVSGNLALQDLLLEGLLENSNEVQTYATRNLAVEAPAGQRKRSASGRGGASSQNKPSKKQALTTSDGKPGSSHNSFGSGDDDPKPKQLQHTYSKQFCPACKADVCKEAEPGSAKDLSIDSQCFILTLPTEILVHIFQYTSLKHRVDIMQCCSRFAEASRSQKVIYSQILTGLQKHIPDVIFPMGKAMSAALEAKTHGFFNNAPLIVKQTLANFYALSLSVCTHSLRYNRPIWCIATFPDDRIVTGDDDGKINVWLLEGDSLLSIRTWRGHNSQITSVATLSDYWVISGSSDNGIKIWDLRRPCEMSCTDTLQEDTRGISVIEALSDRWFYSGSHDKSIKVWHLTEEGKACLKHTFSVSDVVRYIKVLPDGRLFAGTFSGETSFWKTTKADEAPLTKTWKASRSDQRIVYIEMLPDNRLLTHSWSNQIKIWDLKKPEIPCVSNFYGEKPFRGIVSCSKISPDGQMIISDGSGNVKVFTFKNGKVDLVFSRNNRSDMSIGKIAFLHDGRMVATFKGGFIKVWDYADTRPPNSHKR